MAPGTTDKIITTEPQPSASNDPEPLLDIGPWCKVHMHAHTVLPTHPHFAGVTRILQKSPAHPDKLVNHLH